MQRPVGRTWREKGRKGGKEERREGGGKEGRLLIKQRKIIKLMHLIHRGMLLGLTLGVDLLIYLSTLMSKIV